MMTKFSAAGISVFALSYDEVDALADFRDAYDITYPLLSDPNSTVIRQFGILNTLISEDDHPWFGIPFPGTFVINGDGYITHKFFEHNLALRIGPETLLRAVLGESIEDSTATSGPVEETTWKVYFEGDRVAVSVLRDIVARIDLPRGRHLYADPAPRGNVAVELVLDPNPRIASRSLVKPESTSISLAGTGERIQVYERTVELRLPIAANTNFSEDQTGKEEITLSGELRWQTCDDHSCDLPRAERFEITVPVVGSVVSEVGHQADGTLVREMNGMQHFERLMQRRQQS